MCTCGAAIELSTMIAIANPEIASCLICLLRVRCLLASSPGRFIFLSNYAEGRKNGLVFIAWVTEGTRLAVYHRDMSIICGCG